MSEFERYDCLLPDDVLRGRVLFLSRLIERACEMDALRRRSPILWLAAGGGA